MQKYTCAVCEYSYSPRKEEYIIKNIESNNSFCADWFSPVCDVQKDVFE
jgi:rubredoxin